MAQVNLPMSLSAAYWDKQKSALAKAAKPPATKLPDELKELSKLHLGLDWNAFSADKLKTGDEVESGLGDLDKAEKGKIKALLAQLQTVEKSATSFDSDAKKDKAFPKEPLAAAAAIIKAAREYRADVDSAVAAARKALEDKAKEIAQKASGGTNSAALAKQTKLLKSRLLTAIALLRKPQPNARPTRFMIALGSKGSANLALGYAVGPAQEKLLKGLLPGEAPFKILKDKQAVVLWEKNSLTFVSDRLPSTVVKKVQLWLKKLLKLNLKMRVRKSTGEVEETEGGEDLSDDMLKVDPADVEAVGKDEFMARLASLQADIKAGLAGASAARIKELMANITKLTKADKYDDADGELDEIEALLSAGDDDEADEAEVDESVGKDDDKADAEILFKKRFAALQPDIKTALTDPESARLKELVTGITQLARAGKFGDAGKVLDGVEKLLKNGNGGGGSGSGKSAAEAMDDWKTHRAAAVTSLKSVATKVAGAKHASSAKAIIELQAVIKNLTAEPSTLQQVRELQQWLTNDDVVNDVCELDQDIRTPLLGALGKLRDALAA